MQINQSLKKLIYIVFYVLSAPFLIYYNLICTLALYGKNRLSLRSMNSLYLIIPYHPGERSGASHTIKSLINDFKDLFDLKIIPLFKMKLRGGSYRRRVSELLTSALPMPPQCRPFLLSPRAVLDRIGNETPVFIEFVSGALFLIFSAKLSNKVILRDHENLCRRLMMELRTARKIDRMLKLTEVMMCYLFLYNIYLKADLIVTLTNQDCVYTKKIFPVFKNKVVHISRSFNIPDKEVKPPALRADRKEVIYLANFYHKPNVDGLLWFLREVAPFLNPGFTLHLVGLDKPLSTVVLDTTNIKIVKHGFVDDVDAEFGHVGVAISPTISGSGVRIKNLLLASKGKAIVTTELGNEGISFVNKKEAIICNDGTQMAEELNRLIDSPEDIIRLGKNAFDRVKKVYDSKAILSRYRSHLFT